MSDEIDTIAILMGRDPFSLTKADIDKIIDYYAARRRDFATTGKPQPKVEKARPSLDELGL